MRLISLGVGLGVVLGIGATLWRAHDDTTTIVGACGHPQVTMAHARPQNIGEICGAIHDVVTYFADLGASFEPVVTIEFSTTLPSESALFRSHGSYDARELKIRLNDAGGFLAWGITSRGTLARSFLTHELVHMAMHRTLGERTRELPLHWQEFVAYAVQFDLMSSPLREEILSAHPEITAYESLWHVHEFTYAGAPEAFAISAYKTYVQRGRTNFLWQVLHSKIQLPGMLYPPSPVLPGQH